MEHLAKNLRYKKCSKLKTDDISSVFNFKRQVNGDLLRFLVKPNQSPVARLAIIVSKKIIKHAVERNYCKRVIREVFRRRQDKAASFDLVVLVRRKFTQLQFEEVALEFDSLLSKSIRYKY